MKKKIKWGLIILGIILVLTFFSLSGVVSAFQWFVESTGYVGLFIVVFFLDIIFVQPISPTIFVVMVLLGGLNYPLVYLISATASFLAGMVGYGLGAYFGMTVLNKRASSKKIEKARHLFNKYSTWGIILGAVTAVPFSIACWLSGISEVKLSKFLLVSFIARFLGFLIVVILTYYGVDIFNQFA